MKKTTAVTGLLIHCMLLLPLSAPAAAEDGGTAESGKSSKRCASEDDKRICTTVNEALKRYYLISNHVPTGDYERNYLMNNLTDGIVETRERARNESGRSDALEMYTAFIDFVKSKEKTELLFSRQDYDGADFYRETAFKNHDKIIDYCSSCVQVPR